MVECLQFCGVSLTGTLFPLIIDVAVEKYRCAVVSPSEKYKIELCSSETFLDHFSRTHLLAECKQMIKYSDLLTSTGTPDCLQVPVLIVHAVLFLTHLDIQIY